MTWNEVIDVVSKVESEEERLLIYSQLRSMRDDLANLRVVCVMVLSHLRRTTQAGHYVTELLDRALRRKTIL